MHSGKPLLLVEDGRAAGQIAILDASAAPPVRFAAEELGRYIRLMSGAELPLTNEVCGVPSIVLSTAKAAAREGFEAGLPGSEDAYLLRTAQSALWLVGNSPRAVLYAAYDLLEFLGCGFCVPGVETVPHHRTVSVPQMDRREEPAFAVRSHVDFPFNERSPLEWHLAFVDFIAKNRFNVYHPAPNAYGEPTVWLERRERLLPEIRRRGLQLQVGGHTIHTWLPPERYFKKHPEWFAAVPRGRRRVRQPPQACVSHRQVARTVARNIARFLERCPEVEIVDLWDADMEHCCHCPRCLRAEGPSTRLISNADEESCRAAYTISYVELLNTVARLLERTHPQVRLAGMMYTGGGIVAPMACPDVHEKVIVCTAHICRDSYRPLAGPRSSKMNQRLLTMDLSWRYKSSHASIYEYYHAWTNSGIYPQVNVMAEDLRLLRQLGYERIETDQGGWTPLNVYGAARLMWRPEREGDDVIADFCRRYYGSAAHEMLRYWLELERGLAGKGGYIADDSGSRQWLLENRPKAVEKLAATLASVKDEEIRERIRREIIPWEHFGERAFLRCRLPDAYARHWPI